jgi:membrane fusion protein, multidrug efflux system
MRPIPLLTALLVAAGILFWVLGGGSDAAAPAEETPVASAPAAEATPVGVVALRSAARPVPSGLVLRGRTEAFRKVVAMSQVSGLVISEPRRAGAEVKAGEVLCEIDPGERLVALDEAKARLAEAEARDTAASTLAERGFTTETQAKTTRAALEAALTAVRRAELEIQRLKIGAPFDGFLETDTAELGSLMQPGAPCATVISVKPIKLVGFAPETEVSRISTGNRAAARLSDGREVFGTVSFVSRSADETTRTFRVEVTVPNADGSIRDGLTAEILVELPGVSGHLLPPSVLTLDDDGRLGVRIALEGVARFVGSG